MIFTGVIFFDKVVMMFFHMTRAAQTKCLVWFIFSTIFTGYLFWYPPQFFVTVVTVTFCMVFLLYITSFATNNLSLVGIHFVRIDILLNELPLMYIIRT